MHMRRLVETKARPNILGKKVKLGYGQLRGTKNFIIINNCGIVTAVLSSYITMWDPKYVFVKTIPNFYDNSGIVCKIKLKI